MTRYYRRNRHRRTSAARSESARAGSALLLAPPGKRAGRYTMTVLFLVASLFILNFPAAGPRLRVGDVARQDYRARVRFQIADHEATGRAGDAAEDECPRIVREETAHLERLPAELKAFLQDVLDARNVDELAPVAREQWDLGRDELQQIKRRLDRKWIERAAEKLEAVLARAAGSGIMDGALRQLELESHRFHVLARRQGDAGEPSHRSVVVTLSYPDGVREYLTDEFRKALEAKPAGLRTAFLKLLTHRATPTLKYDAEASRAARQEARNQVAERFQTIPKGAIIVAKGDRVKQKMLDRIRAEQHAFAEQSSRVRGREGEGEDLRRRLLRTAGVTSLFLSGFVLLVIYTRRFAPHVLESNTRVFGIFCMVVLTLAAVRLLDRLGFSLHWSPVILAAMVTTVACGPALAFGSTVFLALLIGVVTDRGMTLAIPLLLGGSAAVLGLLRVRRRGDPLEAGVVAGVVQLLAVWVLYLAETTATGPGRAMPLHESLWGLFGGVLYGFLLTGVLPYVERFFDVATELRLLEWTDQNQPLLRTLALDAPGTYHHSTVVSNMAADAAQAIGANALLARAGGYLHDVGKLYRPDYFIENTGGRPSRHQGITPAMSALIVTAHTKDGVELAAEYGVPSPLRRIVAEHHGTSLVAFFYDKALKEAESNGEEVRERQFRYRGPKPRSTESAIVMLADSAESAARSLDDASSSRIERLVHEIVETRLRDGQLDESRMHITDIRRVEKKLVRSLLAISHPRISYPAL